jgi:tungstate transport system substrate-binding protein
MGDTLRLASEKGAYPLCDRATFLALEDDIALELLLEEDDLLYNQYGVIVVSDATNTDGAEKFAEWITGPQAQGVIGRFGYEEFGRALFVPNAEG